MDKSLPFKAAFNPLTVPDPRFPLDKTLTASPPALTPKANINNANKLSVTNFLVFGSLVNNPTTRSIGFLKSPSNLCVKSYIFLAAASPLPKLYFLNNLPTYFASMLVNVVPART